MNDQKTYKPIDNLIFCLAQVRRYIPMMLFWCAVSVGVTVLVPFLEMLLPSAIIGCLESGDDLRRLLTVTLLLTGALAALSALQKFTEKYLYQYKILMGAYYQRLISRKALTTDYENTELEAFSTLRQESFDACTSNDSDLNNVPVETAKLLSSLLGFLLYALLLTRLSWLAVALLCAGAAGGYFLGLGANRWAENHRDEKAQYNKRLSYVDRVSTDRHCAKDIRLYRMDRWLDAIYSENVLKIVAWYRRFGRVVFKTSLGDASISLLREGAAYAYLILKTLRGELSASEFVLYFAAVTGFSGWLQGVMSKLVRLDGMNRSVSALRRYLDFPDRFLRAGGASPAMDAPKELTLKNVRYRYAGADSDTLRNIDLTVRAGEHIGIVGLNGAGKTTLIKLICGLCDVTEGAVSYDGRDIREYDRETYMTLFAAVFQQYSLLPVSICEIVAGRAPADEKKIEDCLKTAGLWERVQALPDGLSTPYDPALSEGGVAFSGGETQKLLLARAIYQDAPVLILDEPTAALDPISENKLYETYHAITKNKTSLFISHRLASTRFCDRILLIENGKVLEEGTHDELLAKKGRYFELFQTQAKYYRETEAQSDEA